MKVKVLIITIVIILISYYGNKGINHLRNIRTIEKATILINEIDNYKIEHGSYPRHINNTHPEIISNSLLNKAIHYQIHGKYYLLSFNHDNNIIFSNRTYVYWSKTKEWYLSDFTEWPEE